MEKPTQRDVILHSRHKPMTEQQLRAAFAVDDDTPLLRAIIQILDQELKGAILDAADPRLNSGAGTFPGGKLDAILAVRGRIEELRKIRDGARQTA